MFTPFFLLIAGLKRVAWPPPPESSYFAPTAAAEPVEFHQQQQQHQHTQPQYQPISQQQQQLQQNQQNFSAAPVAQHLPQQQHFQKQQQQQRPVSIHGFSSVQNPITVPPSKPLSPLPSLQTNFAPQYTPVQKQNNAYQSGSSPRGWAHVDSPRSPGAYAVNQQPKPFSQNASVAMPSYVAPLTPSNDFGQPQQAQNVVQYSPPQQPQAPQQQQQQPFMGTPLRKEAPVTQKPAPVYQSQPVATTFQGGSNRRGDLKWPPAAYKQQANEENEAQRKLALGPAFRPRRVNKDFSGFFAQNALQHTYPGYRVPPGTLHVGNAN
ncbi:hypothetical protein PVAND_008037 [Polypedilum vanderplanki]|uniref:Uncharacterized protein n=1 Tax=Polypedilum vanderplanki TaxID=319348 RepID=A0A9J6C8J1_POLVA|nr:hypothetical protein PVAND_008037 [Polypedilum vanderplanki]